MVVQRHHIWSSGQTGACPGSSPRTPRTGEACYTQTRPRKAALGFLNPRTVKEGEGPASPIDSVPRHRSPLREP